ncbi:hypothetical protein KBD20_00975 [Candidatus Saccharibacteria bacterium]|nr:hypothetical protein [Candidatus Saccharibacteria bacterium]
MKKHKWFKKVRGSYLPCSWQGWALYVPFVLFLVTVLFVALRGQESVTDALLVILPQFVAATVVMTWAAQRKS